MADKKIRSIAKTFSWRFLIFLYWMLFGYIFTGAKTGSVYQASLSYGSNRIIDKVREVKQNSFQEMNSLTSDLSTNDRNPLILIAYKISKVEISDVKEPEPLP